MKIRKTIIPTVPSRIGKKDSLDIESICVFLALGFFWDDKSYYKGLKQLNASTDYELDDQGNILYKNEYFKWFYSPRNITLNQAVDEFTDIFENLIRNNSHNGYTIPISGGLDSRTLVAACEYLDIPYEGYSYSFRNGIEEHSFGEKISKKLNFPFKSFFIEKGVLWDYIEQISSVNECYAEFTHARQFAVYNELKKYHNTFLLGHAGDIFFDGLGLPNKFTEQQQNKYVIQKYIKPSGFELANQLWREYGCIGDFKEYLEGLLISKLRSIDIDNPTAKLRAFKVQTYFTKLSCSNLTIFNSLGNTKFPYCHDDIIKFICTVPENLLDKRRIQIEYIKRRSPKLASIAWQDHRPFNLYTYPLDVPPLNYPYRFYRKLLRNITRIDTVRRNWENQFLGDTNTDKLISFISQNNNLQNLMPSHISDGFLKKFLFEDHLRYYHSATMLVTLSAFMKYQHHDN